MNLQELLDKANAFYDKNDFINALSYYEKAIYDGAYGKQLLSRLFYCYFRTFNYAMAEESYKKIADGENSYFYNIYCKLPILKNQNPRATDIFESIARIFRSKTHLNAKTDIPLTLNLFSELYKYDQSPIWQILHENILKNYYCQPNDPYDINNISNLLTHRIAIYDHSMKNLKFILPVIKEIPHFLYDIVLETRSLDDVNRAKSYGLLRSNIFYGARLLSNYNIILIDQWHLLYKLDPDTYKHAKIITYTHGLDAGLNLTIPHGVIAFYSMQYRDIPVINMDNANRNMLKYCKYQDKSEICVTGPFHFGNFLQPAYQSKQYNRLLLESILKRKLDEDKPVLCFFEDEISNFKHVQRCLNKLADNCTVILKLLRQPDYPSLSKDVIVYSDTECAPNILRFASDFVMCGKQSGTFYSSLINKLPVIPYYSRVSRLLNNKFYKTTINHTIHPASMQIFLATKYVIEAKWPYFFDLLNVNAISDAILSTNYITWYRNNISKLVTELFGAHHLDDAVQLTAENIIRFAASGTFGDNCAAVYFKEKKLTS